MSASANRSSPMANFTRVVVIVISMFMLIGGMVFNLIGVISPSWQVVNIREFQAEHHHGLWLDCTRNERQFMSPGHLTDHSPLHCTYKLDDKAAQVLDENAADIDRNGAAAESEHHQFFGWHKAILIFIVLSLCAGLLSVFVGFCSPCSPGYALVYSFLTFVTLLTSSVSVGIFFFAAHRVDSRFVQGLVATYEQSIGSAFYFYSIGTVMHFLVFILSIAVTYQSLRENNEDDNEEVPIRELASLYRYQYGKTTV